MGRLLLVAAVLASVAGASPRYGPVQLFGSYSGPGTVLVTDAWAVADFNGDGLPDVAVARSIAGTPHSSQDTYPIGILINDRHGRLVDRSKQMFDGPVPRNQWGRMLRVADFNNDGRPDLFLPDTGPEAADGRPPGWHSTLILSMPDGRLRDATAQIPQDHAFTHSATVGDVNGDGNLDIFMGNIGGDLGGSGSCCDEQIWLNDGRGNFHIASGALPARLGEDHVYLASALVDVNGDGAVDLVLGGGHGCILNGAVVEDNVNRVLLNDGQGRFSPLPDAMPPKEFGLLGESQSIDVADLDHDGHPDLVVGSTRAAQASPSDCSVGRPHGRMIQILMGNGDGTFRDETATRLPQPNHLTASLDYNTSLALADINGDGSPEIFETLVIPPDGDPEYARAFLNDGHGFFRPLPAGYPLADRADNVHAFVDFSGKGRHDVFIADNAGTGDVYWKRLQLGKAVTPAAPSKVRVTRDPSTGRSVVAWPYVWGAATYEVLRSGVRIATTKRMRYVDAGWTAGATYTVRAMNAGGESASSEPARFLG